MLRVSKLDADSLKLEHDASFELEQESMSDSKLNDREADVELALDSTVQRG